MKRFLSGPNQELQAKRADMLETLVADYTTMLDWKDDLREKELVSTADKIIKLVKKTKKMWLRGGFIDLFEMGHDEKPAFSAPNGQPIPERELALGEKFPPLVRHNTRQLKGKK